MAAVALDAVVEALVAGLVEARAGEQVAALGVAEMVEVAAEETRAAAVSVRSFSVWG